MWVKQPILRVVGQFEICERCDEFSSEIAISLVLSIRFLQEISPRVTPRRGLVSLSVAERRAGVKPSDAGADVVRRGAGKLSRQAQRSPWGAGPSSCTRPAVRVGFQYNCATHSTVPCGEHATIEASQRGLFCAPARSAALTPRKTRVSVVNARHRSLKPRAHLPARSGAR
jgi:hypothetical protein